MHFNKQVRTKNYSLVEGGGSDCEDVYILYLVLKVTTRQQCSYNIT
jgi:hypothetical protein